MSYSEEVNDGKHDDLLINSLLQEQPDPMLEHLNQLEEAMTPNSIVSEDQGWIGAGGQTFSMNLHETWRYLKFCYYTKGPVANITNCYAMLTGIPTFEIESEAAAKKWEMISEANRMPWRWKHIIKNTYLFNEYETVFFDAGGQAAPKIRNIEPYLIENIKVSEEDPEEYESYLPSSGDAYKGEDVIQHRVDRIGNDSRGTPLFNRCLREIKFLYKHLYDTYCMWHMRARLPIVRTMPGGSRGVSAEADRLQYLPGPNRILVQNKAGEWQFPPEYQGSKGAKEVWELYITSMASGFNLPYFMVAGDYKNNALASTLSANDPLVRLIRAYRGEFDDQFKAIIRRALRDQTVEIKVNWPSVVDKDIEKLAKAYGVGIDKGAVSAQSMSEDVFGKTWEGEEGEAEKIQDDVHRMLGFSNPMANVRTGDGEDDDDKNKKGMK